MANINDISALAGVSKSTVSRYLNNGSVSEKTANKIKSIIDELNYVPNTFAQSLKAINTNSIGTIIPNFIGFSKNISLSAIDTHLKSNSYKMFISSSNDNIDDEIKLIYSMAKQKVDGIILFASKITKFHQKAIKDVDIPFVIIGQEVDDVHCIVHNDYKAGQLIGEYICGLGHRKISYLGVGRFDKSISNRYLGLIDVLKKHKDIRINKHIVEFDSISAYKKIIETYNKDKPTYYVSATDNIAFGIIKALRHLDINIPNEVSISGFGDYDMSTLIYPTLTTVNFSYYDIGIKASQTILNLVNNIDTPKKIILDCSLKIRNSTKIFESL